jgi:transitional endoplasmic reticulum ATPase
LLLIDDIDTIAASRSESKGSSSIVAQLLVLMDGLDCRGNVLVIATTTNPNIIDPALRRPGRFDKEIEMTVPDEAGRARILKQLLNRVDHSLDIDHIASITNGYMIADLSLLIRDSLLMSVESNSKLDSATLTQTLQRYNGPSVTGHHGVTNTNVSWATVAGLHRLKQKIQESVVDPILRSARLADYGLKPPRGVLLYGPPGCSKTSIAKVMACTTGFSFHAISGADIYSSMVGESEETIRALFRKARQSSPSFIFLDELDAIVSNRSTSSSDSVQDRVLSTLLNEMDGITTAKDVIVLV